MVVIFSKRDHSHHEAIKRISIMGFIEGALTPSVHCKVYEDKSRTLDIAREYKYHPWKKYLMWGYIDSRVMWIEGKSLSTISGLNTNQQITSLNHCMIKSMLSTRRGFKDDNMWTPH